MIFFQYGHVKNISLKCSHFLTAFLQYFLAVSRFYDFESRVNNLGRVDRRSIFETRVSLLQFRLNYEDLTDRRFDLEYSFHLLYTYTHIGAFSFNFEHLTVKPYTL